MCAHLLMNKKYKKLVSNFYNAHGFPQCIGAVNISHIPIKEPIDNAADYIIREGFLSINVKAAGSYNYRFFDIVVN